MIRVLGSNNIAGKKSVFTDYCVNKYNLLLEVKIVKFKTSLRQISPLYSHKLFDYLLFNHY
jgi:hypothetical protein